MNGEADELCRLSMDTKMTYVGMHPSLFTGELQIYAMCAWSDGGFRDTGKATSAFITRARTNIGMLVIMDVAMYVAHPVVDVMQAELLAIRNCVRAIRHLIKYGTDDDHPSLLPSAVQAINGLAWEI